MTAIKPDKGKYGGSCNRTACQAPGATWWNPSTCAYYCRRCAKEINDFGPTQQDALRLYGRKELLIEGEQA